MRFVIVKLIMPIKEFILALILSAMVFGFGQAEQIRGSNFSFANWKGAAYTYDTTGDFSHCAMSTGYMHGNYLYFSLNKSYQMVIGVETPKATFVEGEEFIVSLEVDRFPTITGMAKALDNKYALLTLENLKEVLYVMKKGHVLRINSKYGEIPFSLKGTFHALDKTYECARAYFNYAELPTKKIDKKTVSKVKWASTPEDKATMYQIATAIISQNRLNDFKYLSPTEITELGYPDGVLWSSMNGKNIGGVIVGRHTEVGTNLPKLLADDQANISEMCAGELGTYSSRFDLEGGDKAHHLSASCLDETKSFSIDVSKSIVSNRLVEILSISFFDPNNLEGQNKAKDPNKFVSEVITAAKFVQ